MHLFARFEVHGFPGLSGQLFAGLLDVGGHGGADGFVQIVVVLVFFRVIRGLGVEVLALIGGFDFSRGHGRHLFACVLAVVGEHPCLFLQFVPVPDRIPVLFGHVVAAIVDPVAAANG